MDQLKEVLRQMIIYRFWISVGLAALLPMIGYFVAHLAVETTTEKPCAQPGPEAIQHGQYSRMARSGLAQDRGQRTGEPRPFLPLVLQLPAAGCGR